MMTFGSLSSFMRLRTPLELTETSSPSNTSGFMPRFRIARSRRRGSWYRTGERRSSPQWRGTVHIYLKAVVALYKALFLYFADEIEHLLRPADGKGWDDNTFLPCRACAGSSASARLCSRAGPRRGTCLRRWTR